MRIARNSEFPASIVDAAGPALFRLVRFWSRRWMHGDPGTAEDQLALHVVALEAIDAAAARGDASVGAVAAELGIDRSGASRLVGRTIEAGYARKATAPGDGRRADLSITASGRRVLAAARRWQAATFRNLVDAWPPADVEAFSTYLVRLSGDVLEVGDAERPINKEQT